MYIFRPHPSLCSLLGDHAVPSHLLVHTFIGAVHHLQLAPALIKTKNSATKRVRCALYFGQPADVTAAVGNTPPTCVHMCSTRRQSRTPFAYERFPCGGYAFPTRTCSFCYLNPWCSVDKSPKVYTQLAREGVVLTQDSDNL